MSSGDSDMAANAWPGFVDILSAVVIMFVFFVLITAAVLYFYTMTYKAKVESQLSEAVEKVENAEQGGHQEKVKELTIENELLRQKVEEQISKSSSGSGSSEVKTDNVQQSAQSFGIQATEQAVMSSDDDETLVLFHDPGAVTVADDSKDRISEFIDRMIENHTGDQIEVLMTSPRLENAATNNRANRLAVARMLNVRNALLKYPSLRDKITLTVVESDLVESSADWTRLKVNVSQ